MVIPLYVISCFSLAAFNISFLCLIFVSFVSRFWIILPSFWILFQVDPLSPLFFGLVGFFHVPSPTGHFSSFSFCLISYVWGLLSPGWMVIAPFNCGICLLWVRLGLWLMKVSWFGELVSVSWWMDLDLISLVAMQCPVMSFEVSMGLVWLWADCLFVLRVVFLFCWRISVGYLALVLAGSWVELGLSIDMENFGWALGVELPGVRHSVMVQNSGVAPSASGFQSPSYRSIKTSLSTQHRRQNP